MSQHLVHFGGTTRPAPFWPLLALFHAHSACTSPAQQQRATHLSTCLGARRGRARVIENQAKIQTCCSHSSSTSMVRGRERDMTAPLSLTRRGGSALFLLPPSSSRRHRAKADGHQAQVQGGCNKLEKKKPQGHTPQGHTNVSLTKGLCSRSLSANLIITAHRSHHALTNIMTPTPPSVTSLTPRPAHT